MVRTSRPERKRAKPSRAEKARPSGAAEELRAAPRRRRWLLVTSAGLLAAWFAFLVYVARVG